MHSAFIGLARNRGFVRITKAARPDNEYVVEHFTDCRVDGRDIDRIYGTPTVRLIERVPVIDGETVRDTKARCVGAVRMLAFWPALRASIAHDRRIKDRVKELGLVLEPAQEHVLAGGAVDLTRYRR